MTISNTIAKWPPSIKEQDTNQRKYWDIQKEQISNIKQGKELPAIKVVSSFEELPPEEQRKHLESARLYINLPAKFYQEYLAIQTSPQPINFPKLGQNKNCSVRSCMKAHNSFSTVEGHLHPRHWRQLGWASQQAYSEWLDSSMLFAFSNCNHYTPTVRVFDADQPRNQNEPQSTFHFRQYSQEEQNSHPKTTNIYSVTGYEFRGFKEQGTATVTSTLPNVKHHTQLTMDQILLAAE